MLAREVLEKTYSSLRGDLLEVSLKEPVFVEIGDDSDWHKVVKGYSRYEKFFILNEKWVVSLGQKFGKYPADRFDRDIVAVKIDGIKSNEELFQQNEYFYYSLIISLASGEIGTRVDGFFSSQMRDLKTIDFVIREKKLDEKRYKPNLQPLVVEKIDYNEKIVEYLKTKIYNILV